MKCDRRREKDDGDGAVESDIIFEILFPRFSVPEEGVFKGIAILSL